MPKQNYLPSLAAILLAGAYSPPSAQAGTLVANCKAESFVTGAEANSIATAGASYTPKCLHVKSGATVTIEASAHHPLSALADVEGAPNPFASNTPATSPQTRVFTRPGLYGYFCEVHGDSDGDGMAGAIWVD